MSLIHVLYAGIALSLSFTSELQAQMNYQPGTDLFLCCTLRNDQAVSPKASDANWGEWRGIWQIGRPVKVQIGAPKTSLSSVETVVMPYSYQFFSGNEQLLVKNEYNRRLTNDQFLQRLITTIDPRPKLLSFPEHLQKAILQGRVMKGMTSEQVLMALGHPYSDETPSLNSPVWRYYWGSFDTFSVVFGDNGLVTSVVAPAFAFRDMVYELEGEPLTVLAEAPFASANMEGQGLSIKNLQLLPTFLSKGSVASYKTWMNSALPRAFAVSPGGGSYRSSSLQPGVNTLSSKSDPRLRAVESCEKMYGPPCELYAVDYEIVYQAKHRSLRPN